MVMQKAMTQKHFAETLIFIARYLAVEARLALASSPTTHQSVDRFTNRYQETWKPWHIGLGLFDRSATSKPS